MPASMPATYDDIDPAMYDARPGWRSSTSEGIDAQVLYPNVGGFGNGYFLRLGDRDLVIECVQAYNDFLTDWCSVAPDRLIAITALPFWDVDLAVAELQRCIANGHRAVNFCNQPQDYGQPPLAHPHWDPIWAAAQEAGVSVSFHVGGGSMGTQFDDTAGMGWMTNFAKVSSLIFLDNMRCVADLIFGGVCHRFPDLKFVSVESGVGWIPAALETFDWQWKGGGVLDEHPEYDLLPSEYFRRQIYGCFWFEEQTALDAIDQFPDNILYETDYPHPTCQHPGPRTPAQRPRDYAERVFGGFPRTSPARCCTTTRPRSTGSHERYLTSRRQISGSRFLVAEVRGRVLHLRIDRPERRNAFTQDMYRGLKRAAIWADEQPELDAVCLTGTDKWFGAGGDMAGNAEDLEALARGVGSDRPVPVPPHRALHQAVGREGQRPVHRRRPGPDAALRRRHRLGPGPLPRPRAAARHPRPVPVRPAGRGGRARPGPLPVLHRGGDQTPQEALVMGLVGQGRPARPSSTPTTDRALAAIANTGPLARAAIKRDLNRGCPVHDTDLIRRSIGTAEMVEGMRAFIEKREVNWPRD